MRRSRHCASVLGVGGGFGLAAATADLGFAPATAGGVSSPGQGFNSTAVAGVGRCAGVLGFAGGLTDAPAGLAAMAVLSGLFLFDAGGFAAIAVPSVLLLGAAAVADALAVTGAPGRRAGPV